MTREDLEFIRMEFVKLFVGDDELRSLCNRHASAFLPNGSANVPIICERIEGCLRDRLPMSLLRVGNGEGNAIGMMSDPLHPLQISTFYQEFVSQNGVAIRVEDAVRLCAEVRMALISANIVGIRIGIRAFGVDESVLIEEAIRREDAYAALGLLYARALAQQSLSTGCWRQSIITSAWFHLDVIPYLPEIVRVADSIIVITGRAELREEIKARFGNRLDDFITVPVQGFVPPCPERSHFFEVFPVVRERLNQDLRGKLVLVGAGLFGKVYCDVAKKNGAVAVDLGSAFDVMAGLQTRPVHKRYKLNALRWI
jgi:hypothetical protein